MPHTQDGRRRLLRAHNGANDPVKTTIIVFAAIGFVLTTLITSLSSILVIESSYSAIAKGPTSSDEVVYALGPEFDTRAWSTDIHRYALGVTLSRMVWAHEGGYHFPSLDNERLGPDSIPKRSRARKPVTDDLKESVIYEVIAGFPFAAAHGEWRIAEDGTESYWYAVPYKPSTNLGSTPFYWFKIPLPLKPIFPGILINTIIWGAVAWACWFLLRARIIGTIRWRRTRRARCPSCGYDLGPLPTCPECGHTRAPETSPLP